MKVAVATERTAEQYAQAFQRERLNTYPMIDVFEARCGFAIDTERLEAAAKVLACPLKANPPNWQHGRVLYAVAREYFEHKGPSGWQVVLDIGSAKGFSALCLHWALDDSGRLGQVESVDVIDPSARVERNTVAELNGLKTLFEILAPWPESQAIAFQQSTGIEWLKHERVPVSVAFVDGKHAGHVVIQEGRLLAQRQQSGDLAIFDDVHIPDVNMAVNSLHHDYRFERIEVLPNRHYAIGRRR